MANLLNICTLQLLCAFFTPCLVKITSVEVIPVHLGENITLPCDITNYSKISWYRLRSDKVKHLISAVELPLRQTFFVTYNVNKSHFVVPESSSTVSLKIIGVSETDLGFYFCERTEHTPTQFEKFIGLNCTATSPAPKKDMEIDILTKHQDTLLSTEFWIAVCVCPVSILINLILICVFCCIFKGKSLSSCSYSSNAIAANKQEENIQYASVQYKRKSKATAKKNAALESVIYSTVAPKPQSH